MSSYSIESLRIKIMSSYSGDKTAAVAERAPISNGIGPKRNAVPAALEDLRHVIEIVMADDLDEAVMALVAKLRGLQAQLDDEGLPIEEREKIEAEAAALHRAID